MVPFNQRSSLVTEYAWKFGTLCTLSLGVVGMSLFITEHPVIKVTVVIGVVGVLEGYGHYYALRIFGRRVSMFNEIKGKLDRVTNLQTINMEFAAKEDNNTLRNLIKRINVECVVLGIIGLIQLADLLSSIN